MAEKRNRQNVSAGKSYREDDSILDVTDWRERIESLLGETLTFISSVHKRVHQGQMFRAWTDGDSLENNDTINIRISTNSTVSPHLIIDAHAKLDFRMEVLEGASSSGGSVFIPINKNRVSATVSGETLSTGVSGVSGGVTIFDELVSGGHKVGGTIDFDREFILKPDTNYVFRLTSLENSNLANITLEWYEPS